MKESIFRVYDASQFGPFTAFDLVVQEDGLAVALGKTRFRHVYNLATDDGRHRLYTDVATSGTNSRNADALISEIAAWAAKEGQPNRDGSAGPFARWGRDHVLRNYGVVGRFAGFAEMIPKADYANADGLYDLKAFAWQQSYAGEASFDVVEIIGDEWDGFSAPQHSEKVTSSVRFI